MLVAPKAKRPLRNAQRQARYRERHMEGIDGDKERIQFVFEVGTKKRLQRIARHHSLSATRLIEQWTRQTASEIADQKEREARRAITARYKHNG
jgi:hypothetical protein